MRSTTPYRDPGSLAPFTCSLKPKYRYDCYGVKTRVTGEADVCFEKSLLQRG